MLNVNQVTDYFRAILKRYPREGELRNYANNSDIGDAEIRSDLYGSDEYDQIKNDPLRDAYGITPDQVITIYNDVLLRNPSASEIQDAITQKRNSPNNLQAGLFSSTEWKNNQTVLAQAPIFLSFTNRITPIYRQVLYRNPKIGEIWHYITTPYITNEQIYRDLITSDEINDVQSALNAGLKIGLTEGQVNSIYQTVLGRNATANELYNALSATVFTDQMLRSALYRSDEWIKNIRVTAMLPGMQNAINSINQLYVKILRRPATWPEIQHYIQDPDANEISITADLYNNDEYKSWRGNLVGSAITNAFNDILLRDPSNDENNYWLNIVPFNEMAMRLELLKSDEGKSKSADRAVYYLTLNKSNNQINNAILDSVSKFVSKVNSESFTSIGLKAAIIIEALELYDIPLNNAKSMLNVSNDAALQTFFNQAIKSDEIIYVNESDIVAPEKARDANGNLIGRTKEFNRLEFEKLRREIWNQKTTLGIRYSHAGGFNDDQLVTFLAYALNNLLGVTKLSDFGLEYAEMTMPDSVRFGSVFRGEPIRYPRYYNKATGQSSMRGDYSIRGQAVDWLAPDISAKAFWVFKDGTKVPAKDSGGMSWTSFQKLYPETADYVQYEQHHWYASGKGEGIQRFFVTFTDSGYPILQVSNEKTGFFADFGDLLPILSMALAFTGAGSFIGEQLLGSLGVQGASATLTSAVGNTALNTVLSGGDVVGAITKTAGNVAGAYVGDFVGTGIDNMAIGQAAGAGAVAVIQGVDITTALQHSLINSAINAGIDTLNAPTIATQNFPTRDFAALNTTENIMDEYTDYVDTSFADASQTFDVSVDYSNYDTGGIDLTSGLTDVTGSYTGIDSTNYVYNDVQSEFDYTDLISLSDIDVSIPVDDLLQTYDLSAEDIAASGLDVSGIAPDNVGNVFNENGEYVELEYTVWRESLWTDEQGNLRDPSGQIIVSNDQMIDIAALPDDQVEVALETVIDDYTSRYEGQTFPTQSDYETTARPDTLPAPARQTTIPTKPTDWVGLSKALDAITRSTANIITTTRQIAAGTYRPNYSGTSGTYYPQQINQPIRTADGRVIRNNGNGTITTTYPNGQTVTTRSNYTGATSGTIAGIPTNLILIGGAVLLGATLLSRR